MAGSLTVDGTKEAILQSANWRVRVGVGLAAGLAIAYVDNFASGGEVSPIVIVAMLLAAAASAAGVWGGRGWITASAVWICVPLAHLVKHVLGLPDTLQPNTYTSIGLLAVFTLFVTTVGTGAGLLIHTVRARMSNRNLDRDVTGWRS